ncbi:MAG: FkbM family methyltransferase [Burkholderiales bacterium]|nr:FkbM family methyltransferase [Burkholderiales bacterium]
MSLKTFAKSLYRTGSLDFARNARRPGPERAVRVGGHALHYRPGTDDVINVEKILFRGERAEYRVPQALDPAVIVDAGANIGAATLYFRSLWPRARVVCVEASADNLDLLKRNTAHLANVEILHAGLAGSDGWLALNAPPEGRMVGSFTVTRVDEQPPGGALEALGMPTLMARTGIDAIDLLKIDIEGSEYDVLMQCPDDILARIGWIVGEMHGRGDFEILARLARWFDLDVRKTLHKTHFKFNACNKAHTRRLVAGFNVRRLQA